MRPHERVRTTTSHSSGATGEVGALCLEAESPDHGTRIARAIASARTPAARAEGAATRTRCGFAKRAAPTPPLPARLNLKRSNDALAAFLRAMHQRPDAERAELIGREQARLDLLEARIRDRDKDDPTRLDRRLGALEKLRSSLS